MANFFVNPPDELEDDDNVNISNLHRTVTALTKQLNYTLGNIDTENFSEEIADIIENMLKGDNSNG